MTDTPTPSVDPSGNLAGLWRRVRPHRRTLLGTLVLGLAGAAADLTQPLAAKWVIEALARDDSLTRPILLLAALVVVGAVLGGLHHWFLERTAERIARDARVGLVDRLLRARVGDLDRHSTGDLLSRVGSDTTLLRTVATTGLEGGATGAITLVASLILMGIVDWRLLVTTVGVLTVVLLATVVILPRIGRATKAAQESLGGILGRTEAALTAIRTVKASGAEARELGQVATAADAAYRHGVRVAWLAAATSVLAGVALQVSFLAVLGVGGALVANGSLGIGSLVAFLLYLFYLAAPITQLTVAATQLQAGIAAVGRLDELEVLPVEETDGISSGPRSDGGALVFDDVEFAYDASERPVVKGVDLTIPPRGQIALVGPSGAGKTTILSLIERFWDPTGGRITLDGEDVTTLDLDTLRARIGYVEQSCPIMPGTLRDNITYAAPDATDADVREVLRLARLEELVTRLPDGLDTLIGDGGIGLSGGERQRVAIARALLRRPAVLLLDEATSQLDAVNEQAIRDAVAAAARDRAVIVVAHRLSTVMGADRIVVLEDGRIRATGTHAELLESDDLYRTLATTQLVG